MEVKTPDTKVVEKIVEARIQSYLSVLLGSFEGADYYMQYTHRTNSQNNFSWLNVFRENYAELKAQAGWKNDQILGLVVLVQSWLENPYTKEEEIFAMKALKEFLNSTSLNDELSTPETYSLEAELDDIIEHMNTF